MSSELSSPSPTRREGQNQTPAASRSPLRRRFALLGAGLVAFVLAAFAVWYFALRGPRDDPGRLQGEWALSLVVVADDGQPAARPVPGVTIRVTGDRWVWLVAGQEQKRYAITLRPDADSKEIDLVLLAEDGTPRKERRDNGPFTPITLRGVYLLEGDKAKLATAPNPLPRPTSFDATDGAPVWILERR